MTQAEFAKRIPISLSMWEKVLRGERNIGHIFDRKKIARYLGGEPELWSHNGNAKERRAAWDAFCNLHR